MIIRLFTLLFLLPLTAFSQEAKDSAVTVNRLQFGLVLGSMNHEVNFTPNASIEPLMGANYSISLRYFDNNLVGFQAELGISQAGFQEDIDPTFTSLYERKTDYAELLILTQLSIGKGFIQPMLQAGPYVSFPLKDSFQLPEGFVDPETTVLPLYYEFESPFRVNYGVQIGLGLNIEIGPLTIQGDGRYLAGFSDLLKTGTTIASTSRRQGLGWHVGVFWAVRE